MDVLYKEEVGMHMEQVGIDKEKENMNREQVGMNKEQVGMDKEQFGISEMMRMGEELVGWFAYGLREAVVCQTDCALREEMMC